MTETFKETHSPDILNCLANLSNDEVFTPPRLVNEMLDLLPQELWSNPNATFLDPASKTAVFLREIAKRLLKGLEPQIPDLQKRIDHIFQKQLYGIAITQLTGLLSRRGLYCTKWPSGRYSVTLFPPEKPQGNLRFQLTQHTWQNGSCTFCGASQSEYDRDPGLETHAYEFIHALNPQEIFKMKFDVIIGNPPYQLSTAGAGQQAKPLYHYFVEQSIKLNPRYLIMITPSRWMAGGMGLSEFRSQMLSDHRISRIVDFSLSTDVFPGVDIAGGVSYFLWDRNHSESCLFTYNDGDDISSAKRRLDEFDIFVRDNRAITIVRKVIAKNEQSVSSLMSSLGPFGLPTSERGITKFEDDCYRLISSGGQSFIPKNKVKTGLQFVDKWNIIIGKATSAGAATANQDGLRKVIATLMLLEPNSVCTFSYFIGGSFTEKSQAINYLNYLSTKFARFLLLQSISSIDITKEKFRFVPIQDFSKPWTDEELYLKYELTPEEINFIESTIKPMPQDVAEMDEAILENDDEDDKE